MNKIESHIDKLFRDIPASGRKNEIMQEISQNLSEKAEDLILKGMPGDEAIQMAIADIGDIDEIRRELEGSARIAKSKNLSLSLAFSIWGGIIITALMLFINFYYTPGHIWFVYPLFAVIWWPMSVFFVWYGHKSGRSMAFPYSIFGACLVIALMLFINFYYTPHTIWFVYPTFAVIWWPIALCFHWLREKNRKDEDLD